VFETKAVNAPYYKKKYLSVTDLHEHLTKDEERGRYTDTVFLHKLVEGTVNLYKLTTKEGFTYYFAQKKGVLKELPPRYFSIKIDSISDLPENNPHRSYFFNGNFLTTYTYTYDDYLDTLGFLLNDRRYITSPVENFSYTEKSLRTYIGRFNKNEGIPNGGLLKSKVKTKILTGISSGIIGLQYDDVITDSRINSSLAFKLYGLYPLSGVNRNMFAKLAFNYFSYQNEYNKKSIPSISLGLRQGVISGILRPYIEGSIAIASMNRNNKPVDIGFPLLLEIGVNVPIKNSYLTLSATASPIVLYKLNGYKLWGFNVGAMF
jgi:hypothetical protein